MAALNDWEVEAMEELLELYTLSEFIESGNKMRCKNRRGSSPLSLM